MSIRTIKSRATSRERFRRGQLPIVVGVPPVMTVAPALVDGYWEEPYQGVQNNPLLNKTAPGMTMVGTLGTWDDTDGATTVSGRFYQRLGIIARTPISDAGVTELLVDESLLGAYIIFVVTATRGGVSVEKVTKQAQVTDSTSYLAVWANGTFPTVHSYYPQQAIPKPTYVWSVRPAFGTYDTFGEWYKNGVATGVSTETYDDTVEGDVVSWYEWLVNEDDVTAYAPAGLSEQTNSYYWLMSLVSTVLADYEQGSNASIDALISGLPGGEENMLLFTTKDHVNSNYVINEDSWTRSLFSQMASCSIGFHSGNPNALTSTLFSNGWSSSYGGILITPRHVLTSGHTQFASCNGQGGYYHHRWLLENGNMVDATSLVGNPFYSTSCPGNPGYGLGVTLLDRDIEKEGVHVIPSINIGPAIDQFGFSNMGFYAGIIGRSQSAQDRFIDGPNVEAQMDSAWGGLGVTNPLSDYPRLHDTMTWTSRDTFRYGVWGGDSGTPLFVCINGTLFLQAILSGWSTDRDAYTDQVDELIAACDAEAVRRGILDEPTGYTIKRCANPGMPLLLQLSAEDHVCLFVSEADPTPLFALPN